jgi:hypothetical protein
MPEKLFEDALKAIPDATARADTIDACDSAYLAMTWFKSYEIPATAADIVALAALMVKPKIARIIASDTDGNGESTARIADAVEVISTLFDEATGEATGREGVRFVRTIDLSRD